MDESQRRMARAALLMMATFALSRVLGLVRQVVFGLYFGTGPEMDAYVAALRIPEAIFLIVAGGALGSAFIPLFTARLARGERNAAWRLASAVVNLLLLILVPLTAACMLGAPWLVRVVVAPAMAPSLQVYTARLMRVMLLSTAIFGVSGVVMGSLNAHHHFLLPALAPIVYNVALIVGAVVGGSTRWGTMGAAVGMVIGSLLHLLVQLPGLMRFGARYALTLGCGDPDVRRVGVLMFPRMLGVAAVQINFVVGNNLASRLGVGAIAALDYAWRVMLLPQGVFAQAVGTAAFPTFAAQAARGELDRFRGTLMTTLRALLVLTIPASAGLIVLGPPIVAALFQQGAFDAGATADVAWALAFFAVGLTGHSAIEVLARAFYAMHDTWTPALVAMGAVVVNVVLGLTLPSFFAAMRLLPHGGIALANAIAALGEMAALFWVLQRQIGGIALRALGGLAARVTLATVGMALGLWGWCRVAPASVWVQVVGGIVVGVGIYAALALTLRVGELGEIVRTVWRRA